MADSRRYGLRNPLDIQDILLEAQHRWLRPAEICQILENFKKFQIAPEPATMPPSGSLFLFDRKVLRYFRKDGHNWRKKKDGKTVKEAHERLKSGSVDVLHCYYAHGEENENFQRRSYWMLEEELSHIVLVHYLEVKGNRTNLHRIREDESTPSPLVTESTSSYETDSALPYNIYQGKSQVPSQTTDTSSVSGPTSEYEDAESSYSNQASSSVQSVVQFEQATPESHVSGTSNPYCPVAGSNDYQGNLPVIPEMKFLSLIPAEISKESNGAGLTFEHQRHLDLSSWDEVLGNFTHIPGTAHKQEQDILGQLFADSIDKKQEVGNQSQVKEEWQWLGDQKLRPDAVYEVNSGYDGQEISYDNSLASMEALDRTNVGNISARIEEKNSYLPPLKHAFSDVLVEENLKKMDSFNRWMSKEIDISELHMESSAGTGSYWDPVEGENVVDSNISEHAFTLSPSLSDQLFSITDFVPNWGYAGLEVKVLITGKFLKTPEEVANHKWSCMFGEVEVPAEIIADGVLRCYASVHKVGRVPFYVTCSNRLACSEVREFEYCINQFPEENTANANNGSIAEVLKMRFANLLCLSSVCRSNSDLEDLVQKSHLSSKICSLLNNDNGDWDQMLRSTSEGSLDTTREQVLQKLLKENLYSWLLDKAVEGGKGASVLDEEGQGVLHFAAALEYDWALQPTITAGVSVNFRDLKGWTALHWAAYSGRERTVGLLISLGAAPGALTDPTPKYPQGRTAADLASSNGHKGIAGYLAESALSAHLSSLNLDHKEPDSSNSSRVTAVQTISERFPTPYENGDLPFGLSMKDSLAAVCNATQAAARIHQVFRLQSFQRKVLKEYGGDKFGISDERALSMVAVKPKKQAGQHDPTQAAAVRIQNKFRGWKGRREFLIIRQQIVKIQAHVRGHQVRNKHKKITWSVGILEKVILRWRRKGSGLRGFKSEALTDPSSMMNDNTSSNGDDFDFLKEGRKQTEERMQKYLARVKSMVQYPEARDQYRRLLNVVSEIQEAKGIEEMVSTSYEETADFDDDIDIDDLLDEADKYMPMFP